MKSTITMLSALLSLSFTASAFEQNKTLTYQDSFDNSIAQWVVENKSSTVAIKDGELHIDDAAGTTVWFKNPIGTPSIIEFDGAVVVAGGPNDRGTDLNFFWMAENPSNPNFFDGSKERAGDMRKYDSFRLYYVGYGANDNTTTRFRRYAGDGTRPLLPEYDVSDKAFMNVPNQMTNIKIVNLDDKVEVYANDKKLYEINDPEQFKSGYFGFRTWKSHLKLDNFKVYTLDKS